VDGEGAAWLTTLKEGVLRFEGQTWSEFGGSNGLRGRILGALAVGPDGSVWVGVEGGICRSVDETWSCYPIGADFEEGS